MYSNRVTNFNIIEMVFSEALKTFFKKDQLSKKYSSYPLESVVIEGVMALACNRSWIDDLKRQIVHSINHITNNNHKYEIQRSLA